LSFQPARSRRQSPRVEFPDDRPVRKTLKLLLLENDDADAELVLRELTRGGFHLVWARLQSGDAFRAALEQDDWDVIISDHAPPTLSAMVVLADLRATGRDIPFILVSGRIGEKVAVEAMKAGAKDYVLKGDLTRLPMAVDRELREVRVRAEQARMREWLVISDRMASAGTLAAGVAHEINNPLAVVLTNLDLSINAFKRLRAEAQEMAGTGSRTAAHLSARIAQLEDPLGDAREAGQRIRDIVRDVKLFSRPDDRATGPVDVRRVIDSSCRMAWNEIRHRARLVKQYDDVPMVRSNESRLGQVFLNLLVNAAQAMPEGHHDGNEIRVTTSTAPDGDAVVQVADTGAGIPREDLERIFDPFFTTKPVEVGTGLGLAICHRIIAELGGRIAVESEVGKGTTFRLELPAARESAGLVKVPSVPPAARRARLLVVDDEATLARALRRGLLEHHDVVVLTSGAEAVDHVARGARFDAILLDVMMPDLPGWEVYDRIRRVAPDQADRTIFVTGGAFTERAREFLDRVQNPRVDKPIDMAGLLNIVDRLARGS
jgi:signal transduction histidine kinase